MSQGNIMECITPVTARSTRRFRPYHINALAFAADALAVALSGLLAAILFGNSDWSARVWNRDWEGLFGTFALTSRSGEYASSWFVTTLIACFWILVSRSFRVVSCPAIAERADRGARTIAVCAAFSVAVLTGWLRLMAAEPVPRFATSWLLGWWALGLAALLITRRFILWGAGILVSIGRLTETAVVVGSGAEAEAVINKLRAVPGIRIAGVFDDRRSRAPRDVQGIPVVGEVSEVVNVPDLDRIIVALPLAARERVAQIMRLLSSAPIEIALAVDLAVGPFEARGAALYGGAFLVTLAHPGLTDLSSAVKRIEDVVLATAALVLLAPLLLLIAIAVKLDSPGPVLFRQPRYGCGGRIFEVLKFRTMRNSVADLYGDRLTVRDDPRVTRLGRFLRKSSLDELPQFFNVLKGDMSVVGPRPHALRAMAADVLYADAVETYAMRLRVKPGITGWAQVNGWRGETRTIEQLRQRVIHDLYYIEKWSIWWDLYIVGLTAVQMVSHKNAV